MKQGRENLKSVLMAALIAATGLLAGSCQKSENVSTQKPKVVDTRFVGWKTFVYQNIKIIYPPEHPLESTLTEMASGYIRSIARVDELLGGIKGIDTLTVYYYTGYGQGKALTGQMYPFADSSAIHFWLPSFYGPTLMQYILPHWAPEPPRHSFLKHGLISLFDFSGQNYHASTIGYKNAGTLIPISQLAVDTATNSNEERYQSAEAASLCAYLLSDYGPMKLRELYLSNLSFDSSCAQFLGQPVDSVQSRWLQYIKSYVPIDSIRD
jgi:hypothetical protein